MLSGGFKENSPVSSLRLGSFGGVFPGVKCFFLVEISILVDPKQIQ